MADQPNDDASYLLARFAQAWEARGLELFDLAAAMFVHGAAGMLHEMGEERFHSAVNQLLADLREASWTHSARQH